MIDVLSSKQQYPIFPPQDPHPHRKPGDVPLMSRDYHRSRVVAYVCCVLD